MLSPLSQISVADTPLAYRHDAAAHLYEKNSDRIFKGILPMFLYAVAVVQVEVDGRGQLTSLTWLREPVHAPEVVAEIERTVRQAAPFPAPVKLGQATYIETWLWDASGRFQLHTLTEGQAWAYKRIQEGDETCAANQVLHGEAVNLVAATKANSHYRPQVADPQQTPSTHCPLSQSSFPVQAAPWARRRHSVPTQ